MLGVLHWRSNFIPQPIGKCRRVFQALLPYAVEELCNVAESLIVPVRMGIARPTAPFTLASTSIDAVQGSEELFSVEPLPPRPSPDQSSRLVCVVSSFNLAIVGGNKVSSWLDIPVYYFGSWTHFVFPAPARQLPLTSSGTLSRGAAVSLSLSEDAMRSKMTLCQQM